VHTCSNGASQQQQLRQKAAKPGGVVLGCSGKASERGSKQAQWQREQQ